MPDRLTDSLPFPVNRLSRSQVDFLVWLLAAYRQSEAWIEEHPVDDDDRQQWRRHGLEWSGIHLPRQEDGISRTDSSSLSRSLRRLEDRGLIVRRNQTSGPPDEGFTVQHRTTHVAFTPAGRALAEELDAQPLPGSD